MSCEEKVAEYRFRRCQHLRLPCDFEAFRQSKMRVHSPCGIISVKRNDGEGKRIGIITTRRVGNAVARNRMRRFVREIFRTHQHSLPSDSDWLFILRPKSAEISFQDLQYHFLKIAGQLANSLKKQCETPHCEQRNERLLRIKIDG